MTASFKRSTNEGLKMDLEIKHDKNKQRFYVEKDNKKSELKYKKIDEKTLDYFTVFVSEELRNQNIASEITEFALQYAKKNNYKVVPSCPYVRSYLEEHPKYQNLVKEKNENENDNSSIKKY